MISCGALKSYLELPPNFAQGNGNGVLRPFPYAKPLSSDKAKGNFRRGVADSCDLTPIFQAIP